MRTQEVPWMHDVHDACGIAVRCMRRERHARTHENEGEAPGWKRGAVEQWRAAGRTHKQHSIAWLFLPLAKRGVWAGRACGYPTFGVPQAARLTRSVRQAVTAFCGFDTAEKNKNFDELVRSPLHKTWEFKYMETGKVIPGNSSLVPLGGSCGHGWPGRIVNLGPGFGTGTRHVESRPRVAARLLLEVSLWASPSSHWKLEP
jgi:hypothetical protein